MKRRLFHAAAFVSLILTIALAALWVRSFWVSDCVRRDGPTFPTLELRSQRGVISVGDYFDPRWVESLPMRDEPDAIEFRRLFSGKVVWVAEAVRGLPEKTSWGCRWGKPSPPVALISVAPPPERPDMIGAIGFGRLPAGSWPGFAVPHWAVIGLLLVLPAFWLRAMIRRLDKNRCERCGYDLRGTPGSKTCPECGAEREGKPA
jgi:hypothetical protein